MKSAYSDSVIAIGALGGSGTRAVAQMMINAGVYMGEPLNFANDNLFFTCLFKDKTWWKNASSQDFENRLVDFETYMRTGKLSAKKLEQYEHIPWDIKNEYPPHLFPKLREAKKLSKPRNTWGWKEPNTHIFLEQFATFFPNFRYIHVVRNGLDMAFSKNKKQLFNWGHRYGIEASASDSAETLAQKQLDYWIKSTEDVVVKGNKLLPGNFLLIKYEEICQNPEVEVARILDFIDYKGTKTVAELSKIFSLSSEHGRHRRYDLDIFSKEQLEAVKKRGY